MRAVEIGNGGKARTQGRGASSGRGVRRSPIPSPRHSPPLKKKGTSAPSVRPNPARVLRSRPSSQRIVEAVKGHGRVAAAAGQAAPGRNALFHADCRPPGRARMALQEPGRPDDQVRLVPGDFGVVPRDGHGRALRGPEFQDVVEIQPLEERPQIVVAVRTPADDLQAQIDLGERFNSHRGASFPSRRGRRGRIRAGRRTRSGLRDRPC